MSSKRIAGFLFLVFGGAALTLLTVLRFRDGGACDALGAILLSGALSFFWLAWLLAKARKNDE